ncbi:MAG: IS256 family transposase, partial [Thermotogae bacterium]|nr:IS256 family transposase [Thermotogota bacterium]
MISRITSRILPIVEEWRSRLLSKVYTILYIDALFYKVKEEGRVRSKAVYVVVGINDEGVKEILGFWIDETESTSFWYKVLNDLKSRGVEDVLIVSVDNLKGIEKAIKGVYPKAEVQKCVVHQIRNSLKNIPWKEKKEMAKDLKKIYQSPTEELAKEEFEGFKEKWGNRYGYVVRSWEENWEGLMSYYKYPYEMRKLIYTTNIIESVNG